MEACELLTVELRLDRIEAELADELPPHLRSFASAYAQQLRPPPAPDVLLRPATLATARAAVVHPVLADRGLALLRLAAPVALEAEPGVAAARAAAPTWAALAALAAARDAAATARFGRRAVDVLHRLHGSAAGRAEFAAPAGSAAGRAESAAPASSAAGTMESAPPSGSAGGTMESAAPPGSAAGPVESAAPTGSAVGRAESAAPTSSAAGRTESAPPPGSAAGPVASGAPTSSTAGRGESGAPTSSAVGTAESAAPTGSTVGFAVPPVVAGWFEPDGVAADEVLGEIWETLRARHGVAGTVCFVRAAGVRPRAFVVEPGREVIVVIPERVAAPAERFAVLHELGHAVAALALPAGIPRVVDEAAAAYIAMSLERPAERWYSPLAQAARERRRALAVALDRIERALPVLSAAAPISQQPPWALWHDPGAQAAYVAAEQIADDLDRELGPKPAPGALTAALSFRRAEIDRLGSTTYAV